MNFGSAHRAFGVLSRRCCQRVVCASARQVPTATVAAGRHRGDGEPWGPWSCWAVVAAGGILAASPAGQRDVRSSSKSGSNCKASWCAEAPGKPASTRRIQVAREDDFVDGELREVKIPAGDTSSGTQLILLTRIDGQFYATGPSCSHYSARLAKGVLAKDKMHVVCPWHDAAFDVRTGMPVRGPGLQAIPTYPVEVVDGSVYVQLPLTMVDFVTPPAARRDPADARVFVVLGGGAAGVAAADTLRQEGYTGRVLLLTEEQHLPYDRPVLSKNFDKAADPASLSLRNAAHFEAYDIEVRRGASVTALDATAKVIRLVGGEELPYDCALVATGARPRSLPIPGAGLPGVLPLRTPEDAQRIAAACPAGKEVVVIGSSFIGMEVASSLTRRKCSVTVLGMEAVPFERVLGRRLGQALKDFFESKGIKFLGETSAAKISESNGGLQVSLKSGQTLQCDAVIVGVGVVPNATFVAGAEKARDGSLVTDGSLQTSATGLYAAGDVATYKSPQSNELLRVEHWDVAMSQGRVAAKNMLGRKEPFEQTPFFWTSIFGKNLRYVGHCTHFDELLVDGELSKLSFVAYYCHENKVKAVATMACDPVAVAAGELMRMGRMPSAEKLKAVGSPTAALTAELRQLCRAGAS